MHFRPLAGKTEFISIRPEDLSDGLAGVHCTGRTLPSIRGCSIDHEQVHARCVVTFAGPEAERRFRGDNLSGVTKDYADASRELRRAIFDAELEATFRVIPEEERATRSVDDLVAEYGRPIAERHEAKLEESCTEARKLIDEKWEHVEAVAKALYRHKRLDGDRVREIIEGVEQEGESSPELN